MMFKKPLSLFIIISILAFLISYAEGAECLQSKEVGYSDRQSATKSTSSASTISTLQSVAEKNHPTETRLTIPSWLKSEDEAVYGRFLKGVLVYRPDPKRDDRKIVLPISALENPLEGTFDLSRCGDTGNYLSISTGYRKVKKAENASKVEIWFAPRFLIEKGLNTTTKHFQHLFSKWSTNAPVGIFWTWGGDNSLSNYDYLITQDMDELSNDNLYGKWKLALYKFGKVPKRGTSLFMFIL